MVEIPSGSVIITPDDMWRAIETIRDTGQRTNEAVTELKLLVNPALGEIRADITDLSQRERDHFNNLNGRMVDLEKQSWSSRWVPAIVMAVLCSAIAGVLVYAVTHLTP